MAEEEATTLQSHVDKPELIYLIYLLLNTKFQHKKYIPSVKNRGRSIMI